MYKRADPLPPKKLPGHSAAKATLVPLRSTPSELPRSMSKPSAPPHQPWSGSPSGPSQHGHNILQLQSSMLRPESCQAIALPPYAEPPMKNCARGSALLNISPKRPRHNDFGGRDAGWESVAARHGLDPDTEGLFFLELSEADEKI